MSYFLWGPPAPDTNVVIACGGNPDDLRELFGLVAEGPVAVSQDALWRTKIIWICQGPQFTWRILWPSRAKRY